MFRLFSTAALTRMSARHPWRTVLAWIVTLALAVGIMGLIGMKTTTEFTFANEPESLVGWEKLEESGLVSQEPNSETVILRSGSLTIDDPAFQAYADEVVATLRGMEDVVIPASVVSFYELKSEPSMEAMANSLVSADRDTMLIPLTLAGTADEAVENAALYREVVNGLSGAEFDVLSIGLISSGEELMKMGEEDMVRGEAIGIGTAIVILVIVFGALVAAGMPILLSLISIMISFGITALLSQVWSFSFFVTNMITMIGLAVGIDYTLFVVERYREERRHGRQKLDAIVATGGSASKAVAFSGGTVVLALIGMFILPVTIFRAMAIGSIVVVLVSIAMTLTLVPAMLSLVGDRIDWPRKRHYAASTASADDPHDLAAVYQGFWGRLTKVVMARPIISVALSAGLLLALAVPYLDITIGSSGNESTPEESAAHRGYDILVEDFSAGRLSPVQFVVTGEPDAVEMGIRNLRVSLLLETSVAVGLHSTAKIITGAALIMVAVFGGFASGQLVMLQKMGFGLGVAVLLDATIVRSILVPSAMALLGDLNWYLPRWLQWLPDLRVEGGEVAQMQPAQATPAPPPRRPRLHLPHPHRPRLGH